jgi:hypothetical protein
MFELEEKMFLPCRRKKTHMNIKKVNSIAHGVSFTGKIRKTSPLSIYDKSITINSRRKNQQERMIFPRFLHWFSAMYI